MEVPETGGPEHLLGAPRALPRLADEHMGDAFNRADLPPVFAEGIQRDVVRARDVDRLVLARCPDVNQTNVSPVFELERGSELRRTDDGRKGLPFDCDLPISVRVDDSRHGSVSYPALFQAAVPPITL